MRGDLSVDTGCIRHISWDAGVSSLEAERLGVEAGSRGSGRYMWKELPQENGEVFNASEVRFDTSEDFFPQEGGDHRVGKRHRGLQENYVVTGDLGIQSCLGQKKKAEKACGVAENRELVEVEPKQILSHFHHWL